MSLASLAASSRLFLSNTRGLLKMESTLKKTWSADYKAVRPGVDYSRWKLILKPDSKLEDKNHGDPEFVGLYLHLSEDEDADDYTDINDNDLTKVEACYSLQAFCPTTGLWETLSGPRKEGFVSYTSWSWDRSSACEKAIPHVDLFGENSKSISSTGALTVRSTIEFCLVHFPGSWRAAFNVRSGDCVSKNAGVSDFELVSGDGITFPVHSSILAASSSVFRGMFGHGTKEREEGRAVIEDISGEALDILLKFIYSREIRRVKDDAEKVLEAADKHDITDLRDLAAGYLCGGMITLENAYRISIMADQRHLRKLRKAVAAFIADNWSSLRETPEFRMFKQSNRPFYDILDAACAGSSKKRRIDSV